MKTHFIFPLYTFRDMDLYSVGSAWNATHWVNECEAITEKCCCRIYEKKNPLFIWYVLYLRLVGGNSFRGCHSCSLSRMPLPVWAPWLNLVQLGNGLLPNRLTNIVTLHSCWLPIPVCYSAQILDTKNAGAERESEMSVEFFTWSRLLQRTFKMYFQPIFHFTKCQTTKMLQSNMSNSSLWHLFSEAATDG